jgi:hypothetical protein
VSCSGSELGHIKIGWFLAKQVRRLLYGSSPPLSFYYTVQPACIQDTWSSFMPCRLAGPVCHAIVSKDLKQRPATVKKCTDVLFALVELEQAEAVTVMPPSCESNACCPVCSVGASFSGNSIVPRRKLSSRVSMTKYPRWLWPSSMCFGRFSGEGLFPLVRCASMLLSRGYLRQDGKHNTCKTSMSLKELCVLQCLRTQGHGTTAYPEGASHLVRG